MSREDHEIEIDLKIAMQNYCMRFLKNAVVQRSLHAS